MEIHFLYLHQDKSKFIFDAAKFSGTEAIKLPFLNYSIGIL